MPSIAQYKERLLDEFENRTDEWTYGQFESRLYELRANTSYHDAKGIIIEAHKIGRWPNAVTRYILTNYNAHGNVSSELNDVFNSVYSQLSSADKKAWGIDL